MLIVLAALAGCARRGYVLDEPTRRIAARDSMGRVTKWYEPGTAEYDRIALRFYPGVVDKPAPKDAEAPGRRGRMAAFMKGLDKDQWHILLDMDLWTGDDRADLQRLEDMEAVARAVKGMPFNDYLELKRRYPIRSELRQQLMSQANEKD